MKLMARPDYVLPPDPTLVGATVEELVRLASPVSSQRNDMLARTWRRRACGLVSLPVAF